MSDAVVRRLHPVSPNEQFVASGSYYHDTPEGLTETWSIHELPDRSHLIRSDWDGRTVDGVSLLVEALCHFQKTGWFVERFDVRLLNARKGAVKEGRAAFTFYEDHVEIGRVVNDKPRSYYELLLPASYSVAPAGHIFGFFILPVAATNGAAFPVFQPMIDVLDPEHCLTGSFGNYAAVRLDSGKQSVAGRPIPARRFQWWFPSEPERKHTIWLDDYGVLLRYDSADSKNLVRLTRYARRPESSK